MEPVSASVYLVVSVSCLGGRCWFLGRGKASDMTETSSLVVETVAKKEGKQTTKKFHSDASKVMAKGNGLKKAFMNRPATYNIDVKGAGESVYSACIQLGDQLKAVGCLVERVAGGRSLHHNHSAITLWLDEHSLMLRASGNKAPASDNKAAEQNFIWSEWLQQLTHVFIKGCCTRSTLGVDGSKQCFELWQFLLNLCFL